MAPDELAVGATPHRAKKKTPQVKVPRFPIDGVLLLNKPIGVSSNAALQKVRWLYKAEKGGHTGALDPLATGLLPICLGESTKFSHYLLDADKAYITTVRLGQTTTTGDAEGEIVAEERIPELDRAPLEAVLGRFRGEISQVPPMYSALKRDGKPLYELARQGIEVERAARPVTIHALELLDFGADWLRLAVRCSKGTYIRTLAEDIGAALGCGAHVTALHRTQTGLFQLDERVTVEYLESLDEAGRLAMLLPVYAPVAEMRRIQLDQGEDFYFARGQAVTVAERSGDALAFRGDICLGLGWVDDERRFHPKRVLVPRKI